MAKVVESPRIEYQCTYTAWITTLCGIHRFGRRATRIAAAISCLRVPPVSLSLESESDYSFSTTHHSISLGAMLLHVYNNGWAMNPNKQNHACCPPSNTRRCIQGFFFSFLFSPSISLKKSSVQHFSPSWWWSAFRLHICITYRWWRVSAEAKPPCLQFLSFKIKQVVVLDRVY